MSDTKEKLRSSVSFSEKSKEEQVNYEVIGSSRDWKEERNKLTSLDMDNRNQEKTPNKDNDTYKYENRNREDWRDRDRDRDRIVDNERESERNRERDRNRQRSPPRRSFRSPVRPGPRSPDRDRRDRPREREERGRAEQREGVRFRERSHGRERRRSVERLDRNEGRYKEADRSRSSPPPRGLRELREGYLGRDNSERERDPWRRERSPYRERKQSTQTGEYHRELSPYTRGRSPYSRGRPLEESSPSRRSPNYRDYPRRNSPSFTRGASPQRRGSHGRGAYGKEGYSRPLDRNRSPPPIAGYSTRGKNAFPINYAFRDGGLFESKERHTPESEFARTLYTDNPIAPKSKGVQRNMYDRIGFSNKEDTDKYSNPSMKQNNTKTVSSTGNRTSRVNQHYPGNTVSTLRDLSDRPLKRDRGEDPPPPPSEPSESWVEEKRARLRSRIEAEDVLDMELIILSEKQREYAEKVEQRIKHMGVTTSLITLPPSMGVADALDSAVRRNLLYAIIILPQHEQHNSITLTILHGRNPQEHKNMPLEDSLCLINIDHEKYEEAIRDRVIQSREVAAAERPSEEAPSPHSTPEKPALDLEQLSEIVKRFPPTESDMNKNSKDLQAKIIGLLGSSAILPSIADESQEPTQQLPLLPDTPLGIHGPPLTHFGQMHGYPPTIIPPNLMYTFPHPHTTFNIPSGPISPLHFRPPGAYMHPGMLGHPPPFPGGFPPHN